jgi:uncharacterized cupredoxin-like copper-binding protein
MPIRRFLVPLLLVLLSLTVAAGAEDRAEDNAGATVEVRLTEYAVEMPKTLTAGPTTFQIHNAGVKTHSFKIEGPGIDQLLSAPVKPNETGKLEIALQPGEYKVYCPIGNHSAKGMTTTLTVTAKPGG